MSMHFVKHGPRVGEESAALAPVRHPGVVELVDVVDGALRTRRVDGRSLDQLGPLDPDEVAGVAAAVATTLADLHDAGVVHGGIEASHVLVGGDGRIVLCSLGRGGQPADDVAALGHLMAALLAGPAPPGAAGRPERRWGRPRLAAFAPLLRRARRPVRLGSLLAPPAAPELAFLVAQATDGDPARRPTARQVAAAIAERVPGARLPSVPPGGPALPLVAPAPHAPRRAMAGGLARGVALAAVAVVVSTVVGGAVVVAWLWLAQDTAGAPPDRRAHLRRPAATAPTTAARAPDDDPAPAPEPSSSGGTAATEVPVAERVWPAPPVDFADGVLTVGGARYAVGEPGDAVVAGDWACRGERTLALLRRSTGQVFAFDGWADEDTEVEGRPVQRVEGAAGLRVTDHDGDGCDDLEVERPGLPAVPLDVGPPPAGGGGEP